MNPRLFLFALLATLGSCRGSKPDGDAPAPSASGPLESTSPKLSITLTAEQQELAQKIVASLDQGRWSFAAPEARDPANRPVLLSLAAATEEANFPQAGAALLALANLAPEKAPSADLLRLVEIHLATPHRKIHRRALDLASKSAARDKASRQLADVIMSFADRPEFQRGVGRYMIVESVRAFPPGVANRKRLAAVLTDSLDAREPEVAVQALDALVQLGRFAPDRNNMIVRALALSTHTDPLVRGKSLELLGEDQDHRRALEAIVPKLDDENPFVRAMACKGLEAVGEKSSIHALMKLVDDAAKTSGEVSLKDPEGGSFRAAYPTGPLAYVQESAITAIHHLSGRAFELAIIVPNDPKGGLAKQAKAAKQWYEKAKKDIPHFADPPSGTASAAASAAPVESDAPKGKEKKAEANKTAPVNATLPPKTGAPEPLSP